MAGVQKVLPGNVSLHQVDAHNIVPVWEASNKQEYGARTIRSLFSYLHNNYGRRQRYFLFFLCNLVEENPVIHSFLFV